MEYIESGTIIDITNREKAAPHLVLQTFLQRVINGGGTMHREMALGKNSADICIEWEKQKYPIELKIYNGPCTAEKAIPQILKYMERTGSDDGWVVIFDRDTGKSWEEKLYLEEKVIDNKKINVFGC